jgi:hypothetical protein
MTGDLVKAMIGCGKPVIAAVDGVCAGAGAIIAMASILRIATPEAKTAFLFNRVGLAGCDMGACAILPRIIGQGRAAELLYTGRTMSAEEGERWGFYNRWWCDELEDEALQAGPADRRRADLRQHDDQDHAGNQEWNDGHRTGDRGRGAGAGDLHADPGFPPRLRGLRREAETRVRGQLMADRSFLQWPFFDPATGTWPNALDAWASQGLPISIIRMSTSLPALVKALGDAGWLKHSAVDPDERRARRAQPVYPARDPGAA